METVRASVVCVLASGIVGSIAVILMPGKKNNTVLKAIVSIFIVLSFFEPMKKVLEGFSGFADIEKNAQTASVALPTAFSSLAEAELKEIIYAEAKVQGIEIVAVEAEIIQEENCIKIQKVIVITNESNEERLRELEQAISKTAGVKITAETK